MNERLKKSLVNRLSLVLKFVENQKQPYKYKDLVSKVEVEVKELSDLPCEFSLLMQDPELVSKQKNSLRDELNVFFREFNKTWEYFTGDHLHPVPNSVTFNKETYNPTLGYYAMKNNKVLWLKKCGEVRVNYLKHLLSELKNC